LVILVVAYLLFGPEKMLEFAAAAGRLLRRLKSEWTALQLELQAQKLKEEFEKQTREGEDKVRSYLGGEKVSEPKSQVQIMKDLLEEKVEKPSREGRKKEPPSLEDLAAGRGPVVDDREGS